MRDHIENLGMRLGAVILVLATIGAIVFGIINFQQRIAFEVPDDGATWVGQNQGVQADIPSQIPRLSAAASRPATNWSPSTEPRSSVPRTSPSGCGR